MATMTMERVATAIEPKIKRAMENIGLGERADDLLDMLDEMEQDRELEIIPIEEAETRENAINERLIKEIDSEIDALDMDNNVQIKESFIASAEQLKMLLANEPIKKTPDVVMFNKGYVGLVWETKSDESVFVYSIPDGTLFFNKVGVNSSETRVIDASRKLFSDLIRKISTMV